MSKNVSWLYVEAPNEDAARKLLDISSNTWPVEFEGCECRNRRWRVLNPAWIKEQNDKRKDQH